MNFKRSIGKCSRCGGAVSIQAHGMSVAPPTVACDLCGAAPKMPRIETEPAQPSARRPMSAPPSATDFALPEKE